MPIQTRATLRVKVGLARCALAATVLLSVPGFAAAQSSITGLVRDTTGAVLPGVTVEASSPVLIEKVRTAISDGQGRFTIVDLRPGTYSIVFTQAVLRSMVRERYGRVVNVGSLAGVKMMQAPVHYATAKAALKGFTESLAKEVGRYGITVNCVAPGILDEGVSDHLPPARKEEYVRHCALRRVGKLSEAADVIAFVASERASYMNGATVVVDGAV
jgi:hypothetical protein